MEVSTLLVPTVASGQPRPTVATTAGICFSVAAVGLGIGIEDRTATPCGVRSKNEFSHNLFNPSGL